MRYTEPITDRAQSDIDNLTVKAFFNVADWQRIYNNAQVAKALLDFLFSINITFDTVTEPTIITIPTVTQLNTLLANIDRLRIESNLPAITELNEIASDWKEGSGAPSPDYLDANEWEQVIDLIFASVGKVPNYYIYCGVASVGQIRMYQHRWRLYTWIEESLSPVRRARTGIAKTGTGLTWNNGFRRYA